MDQDAAYRRRPRGAAGWCGADARAAGQARHLRHACWLLAKLVRQTLPLVVAVRLAVAVEGLPRHRLRFLELELAAIVGERVPVGDRRPAERPAEHRLKAVLLDLADRLGIEALERLQDGDVL